MEGLELSFNNIELKFKYRSNIDSIYKDFYIPVLREAIKYDRAVGYFTSSSLKLISTGLEVFFRNNGVIRFVVNPYLTIEDIDAIERGEKAKYDIIERSLLEQVSFLKEEIEENTLEVFSALITKNILQIKVAFPKNNSIYHEKFGIVYDCLGNKIAFSGSSNETVGGIKNNFEKIDVFFQESDKLRIEDMEDDFEKLWSNETSGLEVIDLPNSVVEKIKKYAATQQNKIKPRKYQIDAIKSLEINDWHGLFEMATGTGKTITSLLATQSFLNNTEKMFLVILVPYIHLVDQWVDVIKLFYDVGIIRCYGLKKEWKYILHQSIRDFNAGFSNLNIVVSTYKSANDEYFIECLKSIKSNCFFIADECHNFGSKEFRNLTLPRFDAALGLSATPNRWWDEDGTKYIYDFFGKIVFMYDLETAIKNGNLTNYIYNPIICSLNLKEVESYKRITMQIIQCQMSNEIDYERLKKLALRRSSIINNCEEKIERFFLEISKIPNAKMKNTLVYCPAGRIKEITIRLREMGINAKNFDSSISKTEREKILNKFADGEIQVLTAMKCLDEGVDIPSTEVAYFLSSSSNPKEFIQRRGRILRLFNDKKIATIYDYLVLPTEYEDILETVAGKEMPRFAEFAEYSSNKYEARSKIRNLLVKHSLESLLDKFPWDVYKENLERYGMKNEYK